MLGTVVRGMRARLLLTLGCVLLAALAIGSAVMGPMFQVAATNSYVVARLDQELDVLTGLSFEFQPDEALARDPGRSLEHAGQVVGGEAPATFHDPAAQLVTRRFDLFGGEGMLLARPDACRHLEVEGRCPETEGEALMLVADLARSGTRVGDVVPLPFPGAEVTVVGTYVVPEDSADYWFDLSRLVSVPEHQTAFITYPYSPAPLIVTEDTFAALPPQAWHVQVDLPLKVTPGMTPDELDTSVAFAESVSTDRARGVDGGRLREEGENQLAGVADVVRDQQETARLTVAPAVVSLVLVALALLLRLLIAASELRRPELALASLRGLSTKKMWALGLAEPLAILLVATPAGVLLGVAMTAALTEAWLVPGLPLPFAPGSVLAAALVLAAAVAISVVAVGQVLRVSLSTQLADVRRPDAPGRARVLVELGLLAAALVVLAIELVDAGGSRPDATDLVLPIVLALAAGLLATRLTGWLAGWWTRRRRSGRSVPGFVASRAISRRQEGTLVILPVTAAVAVGVFAIGVYDSAATWRGSSAATTTPAPVVWSSPLGITETVVLTHELDPNGTSIMAAATVLDPAANVVVVDGPRLPAVASWPAAWTPGTPAPAVSELISPRGSAPTFDGHRIAMTVRSDGTSNEPLYLQLTLESSDGSRHTAFVGPYPAGESSRTARTPYCSEGCRLTGIAIGGPALRPVRMAGTLTITGLAVDGQPVSSGLVAAGWRLYPTTATGDAHPDLSLEDETVEVSFDTRSDEATIVLTSNDVPADRPVVVGRQAADSLVDDGDGSILPLQSGGDVPVAEVLEAESVPFLGPAGVLIDYTAMSRGNALSDTISDSYVLAEADLPGEVRDGLMDAGLFVAARQADTRAALDQDAYALALSLYAVVAVLVLAMAFTGLAVSTAVQLPARRRDAASLRVVGVPRRSIMASVGCEFVAVLGAATAAGLAAGTLAQYLVVRTVTLGYVDDSTTPRVVATLDWRQLLVLAVVAGAALGAAALVSAGLTVRGARGATLRETAR
jgi:hypothetical protein